MIQNVTVSASAAISLRPLVESAIQTELKVLELGLQRTRERLAEFEQRFAMTSADFERRFNTQELKESLDFIEWSGELKTLHLLEDQRQALHGAKID
jgi:hypothetical protein